MNELRRTVNDLDFCETPTSRAFLNVLNISADAPDVGIGLIVGNAGVGKTTTIRHFAATHPSVYVVTMNGTANTMTSALGLIAGTLCSYSVDSRRTKDLHEMIVNFFQYFDAGESPLLIIDEAQVINDQIIDQLRYIYDEAGVGLVLCGNAQFKNRFNHAEASAFAQVTSRIGVRAYIASPTAEDIEALCAHRNISGSAELKFLLRHGSGSGGLRTVTKIINIASGVADAGKPVNIDHLKMAAGLLRPGETS